MDDKLQQTIREMILVELDKRNQNKTLQELTMIDEITETIMDDISEKIDSKIHIALQVVMIKLVEIEEKIKERIEPK
tara:strand:- start:16 stop:246 length:231 start_codon:yes stop_codon:yes gene_type:complete